MEKNKKLLLIVLGVLVVIGIGVSFAYFAVNATIGGKGADARLGTADFIKVEYDTGNKLESEALVPGHTITKEFKVIITPTDEQKEATYRIYMNIASNTFVKCNDTNFNEVTNNCSKDAEEIVYRLKDSTGTVIKTGDLTNSVTGEIELARETKTQDTKTEYLYTLEVEYIETNKDQNHNKNAVITGEVKVEFADKVITVDDIIATLDAKTETPDFSQVATTDEGVYVVADGMYGGTSYYWRGAVTNNYVKFADKCWRIIRINGDGTVRLIYDGTTCHANGESTTDSISVSSQTYNESYDRSEYVGWTYTEGLQRPTTSAIASNAKTQTDNWFNSNITGPNAEKVANGKFCNDRSVQSDSTWSTTGSSFDYSGRARLYTDYQPTLSCNAGDIYSLKAGAITADETELAGGGNANNSSYYLYNGQNYWTMSPYIWYSSSAQMFIVGSYGRLNSYGTFYSYGLRPVINLTADITFATGGDGTQNNPYVVVD